MDNQIEQIRRLAYKLWQVRSESGLYISDEQNWTDAEKLIATMSWDQINQYVANIPFEVASEEYQEDPDFESTRPDSPIPLHHCD